MAIIDCKILNQSVTSVTGGTISSVNLTGAFADDSTKTIIKGAVTISSGETVVIQLVDTTSNIVAASMVTDTDGTYGFVFTPVAGSTYVIEAYRVLT